MEHSSSRTAWFYCTLLTMLLPVLICLSKELIFQSEHLNDSFIPYPATNLLLLLNVSQMPLGLLFGPIIHRSVKAFKADLGKSLGNLLASCFFFSNNGSNLFGKLAGIKRKVATCSIITVTLPCSSHLQNNLKINSMS